MKSWIYLGSWLSLDVMLGSIASGGIVCYWLGINMPWIWWVALPVSVWVIYTLDHLIDAYRLKTKAHTARHLFHHRYFFLIGMIWFVLFLFCITVVPVFISGELLLFGLGMGGLVMIHLGLVRWAGGRISLFLHKELGVGLIYSLGIWGGPCVLYYDMWLPVSWGLFIQFFFLAMINLLIFSTYEIETDSLDGHTSFARALGKRGCRILILCMGFAVCILGGYLLLLGLSAKLWKVEIIYALMLASLIIISENEAIFKPKETYRLIADGVFLFPALIWLM